MPANKSMNLIGAFGVFFFRTVMRIRKMNCTNNSHPVLKHFLMSTVKVKMRFFLLF
jgi:hypothetical protein